MAIPRGLRLYTGGYESILCALELVLHDTPSLSQSVLHQYPAGAAPTWLTHSGQKLYVCDEWGNKEGTGEGELYEVALGPPAAEKHHLPRLGTQGTWPCHSTLLTLPSGALRLLLVNYRGPLLNYALDTNGNINPAATQHLVIAPETLQLGPHARQDQSHLHGIAVDPWSCNAVATDLGTDQLRIYKIDPCTGLLSPTTPLVLSPGDGPRHAIFRAPAAGDEEGITTLYIINELSNTLSVWSYDIRLSSSPAFSDSPRIVRIQADVSILPPAPFAHQNDFNTWHAAELVLTAGDTPGQQRLLVSNRSEGDNHVDNVKNVATQNDVLAIFDVGEGGTVTSTPRFVSAGGRCPRHMSIKRVYDEEKMTELLAVALQDSDRVVIFEVLQSAAQGGDLREIARVETAGRPGCVVWE